MIHGWGIRCESAFWSMPLDLTNDESTLVQVANVDSDLCRHMASLGHNELTHCHLEIVRRSSIICYLTSYG